MVDIETNGTNPATASILQIAAVKFNLDTGEISPEFFDRCLRPVPGRGWDGDTRQWWLKQRPHILQSITARGEDPHQVMIDLQAFLLKDWPAIDGGLRFWGKPITFDYCFITEYFRIMELDQPCHFRSARDQNSYMAGLLGNPEHPCLPVTPEFVGDAHNALYDTIHQVQLLLAAKAQTSQSVFHPDGTIDVQATPVLETTP